MYSSFAVQSCDIESSILYSLVHFAIFIMLIISFVNSHVQDYYDVIGVSKNSTKSEIKSGK